MIQHTERHPKTFAVHCFLTYGIQLKHRDKLGLMLLSDLLTHPAGTNHPVIMIPITQLEFPHSGWLQWATEKLLGWWSGGEQWGSKTLSRLITMDTKRCKIECIFCLKKNV